MVIFTLQILILKQFAYPWQSGSTLWMLSGQIRLADEEVASLVFLLAILILPSKRLCKWPLYDIRSLSLGSLASTS